MADLKMCQNLQDLRYYSFKFKEKELTYIMPTLPNDATAKTHKMRQRTNPFAPYHRKVVKIGGLLCDFGTKEALPG